MFIRTLLTTIIVIIILCLLSWKLTLILLACIIPVMGIVMGFGGYLKKVANQIQEKKAGVNQIAEEALSNIRTLKAFSTEMHESMKFSSINLLAFLLGKKLSVVVGFFQSIN
mmetsp:Transcript_19650/g.30319  ORF Transcript_19650/g.30319 Transcript_19650/m.30319 type:complete len:112 (-) Transcript_19650:420-755(-)